MRAQPAILRPCNLLAEPFRNSRASMRVININYQSISIKNVPASCDAIKRCYPRKSAYKNTIDLYIFLIYILYMVVRKEDHETNIIIFR